MSRPHVVPPSEFSALRDLELIARTTVEGLRQGLHRSPFHGYSAEFSQYRPYRPGDDLKYVDWKAFGRTDRLYSRQFRETTNLAALFVVDASRSMAFPPGRTSKFALARAAAAVLATLIVDQGDAAGLLAAVDGRAGGLEYVPPRSGSHHLQTCLAALARLDATHGRSIASALTRIGGLLRRRSLVVAVSDFYEDDSTLTELRRLSRMGHEVIAVHVVAREEQALTVRGAVEFVDLESGQTLTTSADGAAAEYRRAFAEFTAHLRRTIERDGLAYMPLVTGESLESSLRRFLVERRRGA